MSNFDEKIQTIINNIYINFGGIHAQGKELTSTDLDNETEKAIDQIKQLISEVIGGEEVKRDVPSNKDDSYESLNAQFKVMKYNQEQMPIRNELRRELRHAFNLKREL